jgi:hypothetical protein
MARVAVLTVTVLCLALAASAMAWRHPTRSERSAITRAASRTPTSPPHKKVHVRDIRVSTVGPWASATIAIYFGNVPDYATDTLHKVHGKWINDGAGTSGEWCVMPRKDRRNLGFDVVGYVCGP